MKSRAAHIGYVLIALVVIIIGIYTLKHDGAHSDGGQQIASTTPEIAALPDYSVTSSPAIRHEDELVGQIEKTIYQCANNEFFTVRRETDATKLGKAEVFLKDYSKILLTQTVTDSANDFRYQNSGGTFVLMLDDRGNGFINEGDRVLYTDCKAR